MALPVAAVGIAVAALLAWPFILQRSGLRVRFEGAALVVERGLLLRERRRLPFRGIRSVRVVSPSTLGLVTEDDALELVLTDADPHDVGVAALAIRDATSLPLEDCSGILGSHTG